MPSTVYIETTVPSAQVSRRTDPGSLHRRAVTRESWTKQLGLYDCWISEALVLELQEGEWPGKEEALELVSALPRLEIDDEVIAVAQRYVDEFLVPRDLGGDALLSPWPA